MSLEPIQYKPLTPENPIPSLSVLNQLLLPHTVSYTQINTTEDAFHVIRDMQIRGAPAIAVAAVLGLLVHLHHRESDLKSSGKTESLKELLQWLESQLTYLEGSRPTAVNLFIATEQLKGFLNEISSSLEKNITIQREDFLKTYTVKSEYILEECIKDCENISRFGADYIKSLFPESNNLNILTHCNTGALATAKYGTALGVIRFLRKDQVLSRVFATETRPYNQGARLTAFECVTEQIPVTLICDSAVSFLLSKKDVHAIVVGADRICSNGDTANKIGTYHIAVSAKYHGVPFFIAAPFTSIDLKINSGDEIVIEERSGTEITHSMQTNQRVVAEGVETWNPGFDVTPSKLISGIFTERGVILPNEDGVFDIKNFVKEHSS